MTLEQQAWFSAFYNHVADRRPSVHHLAPGRQAGRTQLVAIRLFRLRFAVSSRVTYSGLGAMAVEIVGSLRNLTIEVALSRPGWEEIICRLLEQINRLANGRYTVKLFYSLLAGGAYGDNSSVSPF
jgi:hypothetical protein